MPDSGAPEHGKDETGAPTQGRAPASDAVKTVDTAAAQLSTVQAPSEIDQVQSTAAPGSARVSQSYRPPLPPRPSNLSLLQGDIPSHVRPQQPRAPSTAHLQSLATTAVSRTDVQTKAYQDGSRGTIAASGDKTPSERLSSTYGSTKGLKSVSGSEAGDAASIRSTAPTVGRSGENESLLGDIFGAGQDVPTWKLQTGDNEILGPSETIRYENHTIDAEFYREFDPTPSSTAEGADEGTSTFNVRADRELNLRRIPPKAMESEAQAFPYSFISWEANL